MKAKVLVRFTDLKDKTVREVGDEFILSKERFEEIASHGPYVEEVKEVAESATGKRKKGAKSK